MGGWVVCVGKGEWEGGYSIGMRDGKRLVGVILVEGVGVWIGGLCN